MDNRPQKPVLSTAQARQGESTGRMRIVLTISMTVTIVLLGAVLFWWKSL
jgi:hypothetical protein